MSHISKKALINEEIKASEVRVISHDGSQLGIMKIDQALRHAIDAGLDLVEIATGNPPVCKIMDFGKFRFEKEKREKENRKKQQIIEIKELQLTCNIGDGDMQTKQKHADRFLTQGDKVKIVVKFKGREIVHNERGFELVKRFAEPLEEVCVIEKPPVLDGRNIIMILAPKKAASNTKGNKKNENENS